MAYGEEILELATKSVRPDSECPLCHGNGHTLQEDGRRLKCICVIRQEAKNYLGDIYADVKWVKTFKYETLEGKNALFDNAKQIAFKQVAKSFLLLSGMKYSHLTRTGYEVMQAYLTNSEYGEFTELKKVDILILFLAGDPHNRAHSNTIKALIDDRMLHNRVTWVYSPHPIKSQAFTDIYQIELASFLDTTFPRIALSA